MNPSALEFNTCMVRRGVGGARSAIGRIVFGHFEERTPKWRRVLKVFVVNVGRAKR